MPGLKGHVNVRMKQSACMCLEFNECESVFGVVEKGTYRPQYIM